MIIENLNESNAGSALAVLQQLRSGLRLDRLLGFIGHRDYRFLVFWSDGRVVAVCGYRMLETITRGWHCHIHDLAVDRDVRRQGIGSDVIRHLLRVVQSDGGEWIFLDGIDDALGFYDKLGFKRHAATLLKLAVPPKTT